MLTSNWSGESLRGEALIPIRRAVVLSKPGKPPDDMFSLLKEPQAGKPCPYQYVARKVILLELGHNSNEITDKQRNGTSKAQSVVVMFPSGAARHVNIPKGQVYNATMGMVNLGCLCSSCTGSR